MVRIRFSSCSFIRSASIPETIVAMIILSLITSFALYSIIQISNFQAEKKLQYYLILKDASEFIKMNDMESFNTLQNNNKWNIVQYREYASEDSSILNLKLELLSYDSTVLYTYEEYITNLLKDEIH